jgi:hypothetical protein
LAITTTQCFVKACFHLKFGNLIFVMTSYFS